MLNPNPPTDDLSPLAETFALLAEIGRKHRGAYAIGARNRMKGAYHGLAFCWERLGDGSRAVEVLENLVKVDPLDERALRELGRLYTHRGLINKAISAYEALEGRYPQMRDEIARLESLNR